MGCEIGHVIYILDRRRVRQEMGVTQDLYFTQEMGDGKEAC